MNPRFLTGGLLALALGGCSLLLPDPLEDAREAYLAQDYLSARDQALVALQADDEDAAALELLTRIQLAMGAGADVPATLDRLEAVGALPPDAAELRAEALLQLGARGDALAMLEGRESAESWRLRALAAAMADDHAGARAAYANGHVAPGDRRKLFTAEASYYLARNDADGARAAVGQAQRLAPDSIETLFVSARLAQLDGQPRLATRAYLAILQLTPNDRPALLGAIAESDKIGRIDLVRDLIQRGRVAYPQDVEFLYYAASLKAYDGDWVGTRDMLQQHEAAIAGHDNARGLYGQALLALGQIEQAHAQLAPLHRRYPDNAAYARLFAEVLLAAGDRRGARRVIDPFARRVDAQPIDRELAARTRG